MKRNDFRMLWLLVAAALLALALQLPLAPDKTATDKRVYCTTDSDCAPAGCCHPASCVNRDYKPDCRGVFCTEVCSGPLDCGAGRCACVANNCQVV